MADPAAHAGALANLSLTLNWAGKNEESRRLAQQALDSGHEDPTMLMMVARHAALEGENEKALHYFRRAAAASPNSPVVRSQLGMLHSGRGDREAAAAQFFMATLLWDDNEIYLKTSPMTTITKASTPTLIQHGEFDRRVPIPNAYELFQGLQDVGVETKLIVYKGFGHGC